MIKVTNLATLEVLYYHNLTPKQAVVNAYESSIGNNNTWDYDYENHPQVVEGSVTIACGDYCTFKDQN